NGYDGAIILFIILFLILLLDTGHTLAKATSSYNRIEFWDRLLVQGELTAASGSKPFGGERVGSYAIQPQAQMLSILVGLEKAPSAGKVFKAWLVDTKASSYLSLGEVSADGKLTFNQNIGKPHAYNQILISEESPNSSTPKPSQIIGGDALPAPFGT
ncbi:MAG: hypothetical protein WBQ25_06225, partial [Nitrososphaeraceae archaeon]